MILEKQEIRILQPKISDGKTDSFFYDSSIAHAIRSDGTAILLIANGDIRIEIDGEDYDNKTKEDAIKKYDLTDKKLADLVKEGRVIFRNNNWFEIIYTRDGMGCWASVDNTVEYDYAAAIQLFKDCYNRQLLSHGQLVARNTTQGMTSL